MSAKRTRSLIQDRKTCKTEQRNRRRRLRVALEPLESRMLLAFSASAFADINQFGVSANVDSIVEFDGRAFFAADDGQTGSELWSSDGTPGGTSRFADLLPGTSGSQPSELTVVGTELFFTARDDSGEFDLWKTDGTLSGTKIVYDANTNGVYGLERLTESGGKLFFTAYQIDTDPSPVVDNATGQELWVSDGTSAGTMMLLDINPNQTAYGGEGPQELTDHNGTLFFTSYDSDFNRDLWSSGGTTGTTIKVADLTDLTTSELTSVGTNLFFATEDVEKGQELYVYDGTTTSLLDVNVGLASSDPQDITAFDNGSGVQAYFSAHNGSGTRSLFKSDGATFTLVNGGTVIENPRELTVVGTTLFFSGTDATVGRELWRTDGTTNTLVEDIVAGGSSNPTRLTEAGGKLYFSADEPTTAGRELWRSEGAFDAANTARLVDSRTGVDSGGSPRDGDPQDLVAIGSTLYFTTLDNHADRELWTSAGVVGDPATLKNINPATKDAGIEQVVVVGTDIYFVANDGINGQAVWVADTNSPGTVTMIDMTPGTSAETISGLSVQNGEVWFYNNLGGGGSNGAIYRTTGTFGGTTEVAEQTPIPFGASQDDLFVTYDGQVYFASEDNQGIELWRSDVAGTSVSRFADIFPGLNSNNGPNSSDPGDLVVFNNKLYFAATSASGRELWETDGITTTLSLNDSLDDATSQVARSASPQQLTVSGTHLFFSADGIEPDDSLAGIDANNSLHLPSGSPDGFAGIVSSVTAPDAGTLQTSASNNAFIAEPMDNVSDGPGWLPDAAIGDVGVGLTTLAVGDLYIEDVDGTDLTTYQWEWTIDALPGETLTNIEFQGFASGNEFDGTGVGAEENEGLKFTLTLNAGTPTVIEVKGDALDNWTAGRSANNINLSDPGGTGITSATVRMEFIGDQPDADDEAIVVNAVLTANSGNFGRELWSVNTSGQVKLIETTVGTLNGGIDPGTGGSFPENLTDVNGTLYFSADNASDEDDEPYTSDGLTATRIANINTTTNIGSYPAGFTAFGPDVYFAATSTNNGRELWKATSPTTAVLVHDVTEEVAPSVISTAPSASPTELYAATGRLFYSAADEYASDRELWTTGGPVASGSVQALDLFPGIFRGSHPTDIVEIGGTVYFVGEDELSGRELFVLNQTAVPQVESVVINDGSVQRSQITSVTVTFDGVVDVNPSGFSLTNIDTLPSPTVVTNLAVDISEQNNKTVAVLTFGTNGASVENRNGTGVLGNSLADGNYRLDLLASAVTDPTSGGGAGLAADYAFGGQLKNAVINDNFYRLYGDIDGDGDTDFTDFADNFLPGFGAAFGQPEYRSGLDYEGDGDQDFTDFADGFLPHFGAARL